MEGILKAFLTTKYTKYPQREQSQKHVFHSDCYRNFASLA